MLISFLSLFLPKVVIMAIALLRLIALLVATIQVLLGELRGAAVI